MSFETDVVKDGVGRVIRIDISFDRFSTITHRFGSASGYLDGANRYSSRVISMGPITRGFGESRIAAAGEVSVVLDNTDGALDSLIARSAMATWGKLRARIYVCVFDPATPNSFASKLLGEFTQPRWPRANTTTITLDLADDMMGDLSQTVTLPTIYDWSLVGTAANNPLKNGFALPDVLDTNSSSVSDRANVPIQLAFGEDWIRAYPHILPQPLFGAIDDAYKDKVIVPICCTTDPVGSGDVISAVKVQFNNVQTGGFGFYDIQAERSGTNGAIPVWYAERSPTITKNGRSFRIIYLVVSSDLGALSLQDNFLYGTSYPHRDGVDADYSYNQPAQFGNEFAGGYPTAAVLNMRTYASSDPSRPQYGNFAACVFGWYVKGKPLSARTQQTSAVQHSVDVVRDLAEYYSQGSTVTDGTSRTRIRAATPQTACTGVIQPWTSGGANKTGQYEPPASFRQVLTLIARSADMDLFINWDGKLAYSADVYDYSSATLGPSLRRIPETIVSEVESWVPAEGERGAPSNRVFFNGGKDSPPDGKPLPYQGPFDFYGYPAIVSPSDRLIEATMEQGWRPYRQQVQSPWQYRLMDTQARPKVRFRSNITTLLFDLGDYFKFTWTRGIGGPFVDSIFKIESITYASSDDTVEIEAIWRDDIASTKQYLLDDESLLVRTKNVSGVCTPTPSSDTATFSGGINLTTMGVQAGDLLVCKDSTAALDNWSLFQTFLISAVPSSTTVKVGPSFDAVLSSVSLPNADWYIVRGADTYPTVGSDPTNYPDGGGMYGKVTDSSGHYEQSGDVGNQLLNG